MIFKMIDSYHVHAFSVKRKLNFYFSFLIYRLKKIKVDHLATKFFSSYKTCSLNLYLLLLKRHYLNKNFNEEKKKISK